MRVNKNVGIYRWYCRKSKKSYIGQSMWLRKRKVTFYNFNKRYGGSLINKARAKYNDASYWDYEVLEYCTVEELDEREIYYIALYESNNPEKGYNLTIGGDGTRGCKATEETKQRLIDSHIGKGTKTVLQYSKEGNFIREWESVKEAEKAYNVHGISACCNGKQKTVAGHIWQYKTTDDYPLKIEIDLQRDYGRPILQYSLDGDFIAEWRGIAEASKVLNLGFGSISSCVQGSTKTAHGYVWKTKPSDKYPLHIDVDLTINKSRHILQYNQKGEFMREWFDSVEVAKAFNMSTSTILNVCNGYKKTAGGYVWKWRNVNDNYPLKIDVNLAIDKGKHILQYDMNGDFIKEWINAKEAADATNIPQSSITHCASNNHSYSNGYVWRYKTSDDFPLHIDVEISHKCGRRVLQYTLDGEFIKEWDSARQAGIAFGKNTGGSITDCCKGRQPSAYGYKWRYA